MTVTANVAGAAEGHRILTSRSGRAGTKARQPSLPGQAATLTIPHLVCGLPTDPSCTTSGSPSRTPGPDDRLGGRATSGCARSRSAKTPNGVNRLFLNNEPLFQFGPLDQGWWPDGLYTAPTDKALRYDLEMTKALGFNMLRKHVKVEPQRLYYWCDKLGLLVWQDMPSGLYERRGRSANDLAEADTQWELELRSMIDALSKPPLHRHVGAVQRGLGPIRHATDRRLDQEV